MGSLNESLPLNLASKVAIVTGASRGIGAALALELANRGAKVALTYTSESSTKATQELATRINNLGTGARAISIRADLSKVDAPAQIVCETTAAFGESIDILVNNAGVQKVRKLEDIQPEDVAAVIDLNFRGVLLLTQAVAPRLRAPGRVINISSAGSRWPALHLTLYLASKGALEAMTRALAVELGPLGHTVNVVAPGPVATEMLYQSAGPELLDTVKNLTPVGRLGQPNDIAGVVGLLTEESSRWITGQTIMATGGFYML